MTIGIRLMTKFQIGIEIPFWRAYLNFSTVHICANKPRERQYAPECLSTVRFGRSIIYLCFFENG